MVDEWILHSGGAVGADSVFGVNAEQHGITEQHYSFRGHRNCRSRGRVILTEDQLRLADADLIDLLGAAVTVQREPGSPAWHYWQRDWYQVQRTEEVFVVAKDLGRFLDVSTPGFEGAAIAVIVAITRRPQCQRVCAFDQSTAQWYEWRRDPARLAHSASDARFEPVAEEQIRIRGHDFTGIGTTTIKDAGVRAVTDLFARSYAASRDSG